MAGSDLPYLDVILFGKAEAAGDVPVEMFQRVPSVLQSMPLPGSRKTETSFIGQRYINA